MTVEEAPTPSAAPQTRPVRLISAQSDADEALRSFRPFTEKEETMLRQISREMERLLPLSILMRPLSTEEKEDVIRLIAACHVQTERVNYMTWCVRSRFGDAFCLDLLFVLENKTLCPNAVAPAERPPALQQEASNWIFFTLPPELMMHCLSFLSKEDTQRFRTLCRRTRDMVDLDPLSPYWQKNAKVFFTRRFHAMSGIRQFEWIAKHLCIAQAAKDVLHIHLDHTVHRRDVLHYDHVFREHNVRYGFDIHGLGAGTKMMKTIFSQDLAVESVKAESGSAVLLRELAMLSTLKKWKTFVTPDTSNCIYQALPSTVTSLTIPARSLSDMSVLNTGALKELCLSHCPPDLNMAALPVSLEKLALQIDCASIDLAHLVRLTSLDLSRNEDLRTFDAKNVPVSLRVLLLEEARVERLVDIERLIHLEELNVTGTYLQTLKGLEKLPKLRHLEAFVYGNFHSVPQHLPANLVHLDIGPNMPLDCLTAPLPPKLEYLDIAASMDGIPAPQGGLHLPSSLQDLHLMRTEHLRVPIEEVRAKNGVLVPWNEFVSRCSVKRLYFGELGMKDVEGVTFAEGIEELKIWNAYLDGWQPAILPRSVRDIEFVNIKVRELDFTIFPPLLRRLRFDMSQLTHIKSLAHLDHLVFLDLSSSPLVSIGTLPPNLVFLDLSETQLDTYDDLVLPSTLYELRLERNTIRGTLRCNPRLSVLTLEQTTLPNLDRLQLNQGLEELILIETSIELSPDGLFPYSMPMSLKKIHICERDEHHLVGCVMPPDLVIVQAPLPLFPWPRQV